MNVIYRYGWIGLGWKLDWSGNEWEYGIGWERRESVGL